MTKPHMSNDEIARRGKEWYENSIRAVVETEANDFKIILIDVLTGDYEIDNDANAVALSRRMHAKHPASFFYKMRIGYPVVYSFGGVPLMPSKQ